MNTFCCIVGKPSCGKTGPAKGIARYLRAVTLDTSKVVARYNRVSLQFAAQVQVFKATAPHGEAALLPDDLVIEALDFALAELDGEGNRQPVVLIGFPRTRPQAEWLHNYLQRRQGIGQTPKKWSVVYINTSDEQCVVRNAERRQSETRPDSADDVHAERLRLYHLHNHALSSYLNGSPALVYDVNGDLSPDGVVAEAVGAVQQALTAEAVAA